MKVFSSLVIELYKKSWYCDVQKFIYQGIGKFRYDDAEEQNKSSDIEQHPSFGDRK